MLSTSKDTSVDAMASTIDTPTYAGTPVEKKKLSMDFLLLRRMLCTHKPGGRTRESGRQLASKLTKPLAKFHSEIAIYIVS